MSRRLAPSLVVAIAAMAAIAAIVAIAAAAELHRSPTRRESAHTRRFRISGHIRGLAPGVGAKLRLRVSNPYGFRLVVRQITVRVGDANGACNRANLKIRRYRGRLRIPARRSRRVVLPARLKAAAPTACQGARFPLAYRGRGVRG